MKLSLSADEVKEIVKKHLEEEFKHEVATIEADGLYGSMTVELGAKKQTINILQSNHPWITQTTPHTGTAIPRDTFISSDSTGSTIIKGAQVGISELKSVTGANPLGTMIKDTHNDTPVYDGADTPASRPWKV